MRILTATHYFGSHRGGIEIVAGKLFQELALLDQEVVWVASDATPPPQIIGKSHAVGMPAFNIVERKLGVPFPIPTPQSMRQLRKEVRAADIVILHDCLYLTNILAFLFAQLYAIPVIIVQHVGAGAYTHGPLNTLMKLGNTIVTRPMLRRAQQVVFISETTKNYFDRLRFRRTPEVIFNGVDTSVFRPLKARERKVDLRRSLDLPAERPVILFVGRFVEWKGLSVLRRMVEREPGYTWVFAGWGPVDPQTWNAPNVHVFSELHGSALADLYRASDVFVLPSLREGFPVVIQEALASGLPVICGSETLTADSALKTLIHGIKLTPEDDDASATAFNSQIEQVLSSNAPTAYWISERRKFALSRYCWRATAERYLDIVRHLLSESKDWDEQTLSDDSDQVSHQKSAMETVPDEVTR